MDKQQFRDMCAAMVAQGLASQAQFVRRGAETTVAVMAFDIADAMAAERQRRERSDAAGLVDKINAGPDGR